jgi:glycosyltransferase 2 family protein
MSETRRVGNQLFAAAKIVISVCLFTYCLSSIELGKVTHSLTGANIGYLIIAAALVLFETMLGAYRFKLLFDRFSELKLSVHIYQYFAAGYFNLFLPSSIGGDAMRVLWLAKTNVTPSAAFSLIVIERVMGVASLILLSALAQCWVELAREIEVLVTVALLATIIGLGLLIFSRRLWRRWRVKTPWIRDALSVLDIVVSHKGRMFAVFFASMLYQIMTVGITYLVVLAFSLPLTWLTVYALVPLVWFVTFLPISVGGLGIREASFIYLFATVGTGAESALVMSIGTYAVFIFAGIVGGVWFTARQIRTDPRDR